MSHQFEDVLGEPGQPTLAVRLSSSQPRGERLVGTCLLAAFMTAVVAAIVYAFYQYADSEYDAWLVTVVWMVPIGLFALLAMLLLWSAMRQSIALTVPMTIVEVDKQPVAPGESVEICVKQPGPLHLKSIRVNVLCTQQQEEWDVRLGKARYLRSPAKSVFLENILDTGGGWVRGGYYRKWTCSFVAPGHADPSGKEDSVVTTWTLELWGKGLFGLVGFFYQFPIKIANST